jgi:hypothetical protein
MPLGKDDKVARVVGIEVERYNKIAYRRDHETLHCFGALGDEAKNAAFGSYALEVGQLIEIEEVFQGSLLPREELLVDHRRGCQYG